MTTTKPDTKTAHTPGPWHFYPQEGYFPRVYIGGTFPESAEFHGPYIVVNGAEPGADMETHEANARLIATAPEMLRELKRDLQFAREMKGLIEVLKGKKWVQHTMVLSRIEMLTAAIAKAEGRS